MSRATKGSLLTETNKCCSDTTIKVMEKLSTLKLKSTENKQQLDCRQTIPECLLEIVVSSQSQVLKLFLKSLNAGVSAAVSEKKC